jgi:hypothetical protein
MKYRVSWEETIRCDVIVEADSPEDAKLLIESGMEIDEDVSRECEFNGVTMVEEIDKDLGEDPCDHAGHVRCPTSNDYEQCSKCNQIVDMRG